MSSERRDWASLASQMTTVIRDVDVGTPPFGPGTPGILLHVPYNADKEGLLAGAGKVQGDRAFRPKEGEGAPPFVTLTYVDGGKYTIGNTYVSRETQGEFIFLEFLLSGKSRKTFHESPKEGNYVSLECKEEGLWISPHSSIMEDPSSKVLVNGSLVKGESPREWERELVFGDIVSISVDDGRTLSLDLLFWTPTQTSLTHAKDVVIMEESRTFSNPLIAEKILSFSLINRIKSLRRLSQVWNTEGLNVMRNRVRVTPFVLKGNCKIANELMRVSAYPQSQMCEMKFPHWKIGLQLAIGDVSKVVAMKEKKMFDDLARFFGMAEHNVTTLLLTGFLGPGSSLTMLEALLGNVKDTLTILKIEMRVFGESMSSSPSLGFDIPGLKSLSLSITTSHNRYRPDLQPLVHSCLQLAHSVQSLSIRCTFNPYQSPRQNLASVSMFFGGMVRVQRRDAPSKFSKLEDIRITINEFSRVEIPLGFLRLEYLKRLELLECFARVIDLGSILMEHASSLEILVLHYVVGHGREPQPVISLSFPQRMKNLKSLSLLLSIYSPTIRFRLSFTGDVGGVPNVVGQVDYPRHFPSLSKLTMRPVGSASLGQDQGGGTWGQLLPVFRTFLQPATDEDGNIIPVTSIQTLDIPFQLRHEYYEVLDDLEATFPNVAFPPELVEARGGHQWMDEAEED